jgi:hypothetical protein
LKCNDRVIDDIDLLVKLIVNIFKVMDL